MKNALKYLRLGAFATLLALSSCAKSEIKKQSELENLIHTIDSVEALPEDTLQAHWRNLISRGVESGIIKFKGDSTMYSEGEFEEIFRRELHHDNPDSTLIGTISTEFGYIAAGKNESEKAIKFYRLSIKFFPQNSRAYEGIVSEYLKRKDINSAEEYAEKAIKNCNREFINYLMLAEIQLKREKYKDCNTTIKKGLNERRGKRIDSSIMKRLRQIKQEATREKNHL